MRCFSVIGFCYHPSKALSHLHPSKEALKQLLFHPFVSQKEDIYGVNIKDRRKRQG